MKALFIGGTGTISTEISKLCIAKGWDLTLLNRGNRIIPELSGAHLLKCDISREDDVQKVLAGTSWDVVADFIAFTPDQARRDIRLFVFLYFLSFRLSEACIHALDNRRHAPAQSILGIQP